jgi:hypothetical protein
MHVAKILRGGMTGDSLLREIYLLMGTHGRIKLSHDQINPWLN